MLDDSRLCMLSLPPQLCLCYQKGSSPAPISIDLAHRRACHAGENRVRKQETCGDGIKLKKGAGVTFPCAPCIKGKGYALPLAKKDQSDQSLANSFILSQSLRMEKGILLPSPTTLHDLHGCS